jgi:hypothetical protein
MDYDTWRWSGLDDSRPFTREERDTYDSEDHRDSFERINELFDILHRSYLGSRIDYYNLFKTMDELDYFLNEFSESKKFEIYENLLENNCYFLFIDSSYKIITLENDSQAFTINA